MNWRDEISRASPYRSASAGCAQVIHAALWSTIVVMLSHWLTGDLDWKTFWKDFPIYMTAYWVALTVIVAIADKKKKGLVTPTNPEALSN